MKTKLVYLCLVVVFCVGAFFLGSRIYPLNPAVVPIENFKIETTEPNANTQGGNNNSKFGGSLTVAERAQLVNIVNFVLAEQSNLTKEIHMEFWEIIKNSDATEQEVKNYIDIRIGLLLTYQGLLFIDVLE
ncbi:MAG: hypothetical protein ABIA74_02555, partial [bacterium]